MIHDDTWWFHDIDDNYDEVDDDDDDDDDEDECVPSFLGWRAKSWVRVG